MSIGKNILIIVACLGLTTSCAKPNVLTDFSQQNSDDALYIEAQKLVDQSDWDGSIAIIENKISSGYRTKRNVINTWAGAYAGKCGINFAGLVLGLKNASGSASQLFPFFMNVFAGVTVLPTACETAITLMQSIGAVGSRTTDENLFLSVLGISRVATNLAAELDSADHNGSIDSSSNVCHEWSGGNPLHPWLATDPAYALYPPPATQPSHFLKDSEVQRIAAGIGLIVENASALSDTIGSSNSILTALTSVQSSCTSLGVSCTGTDPAAVSNQLIYAVRALLSSSSMGFGTCVPGSVTAGQICCPTVKPPPASGAWP